MILFVIVDKQRSFLVMLETTQELHDLMIGDSDAVSELEHTSNIAHGRVEVTDLDLQPEMTQIEETMLLSSANEYGYLCYGRKCRK